ncbi:hypothetical protein [Halolactibacillus sp. JCM 19043]|uniref:hypothetical protein n=1 Tax=Halolactibacillus sp. JCM 19043 TaxID=1460638 RepID=UPI0007847ABA|nr:hypothetical protein [Halolactibacillus sp. JCM 19043]
MYEWLKDYQFLEQETDYLEFELERYKKELKRWTYGDLQNVQLTDQSKASQLEQIIERKQHELAHKMNDLYDAKKLISLFKGLDNKILYLKYVEGMKLIDIADRLNLSPNYIYSKHAEIIKMIKFANNLTFS